jgi:hypothetical protein
MELKEKYDREGVEFIEDEGDMEGRKLTRTKKGTLKPGMQGLSKNDNSDVNMGGAVNDN